MSDFSTETRELVLLAKNISGVQSGLKRKKRGLLSKIGATVSKKSKRLCLESPTLADYRKINKSGKTRRKASSITSGNLRDSIQMDVEDDSVSIGIPSNSKGAGYAVKIHDKRGDKWKELGYRSSIKRATDKFIFKAYDAEEKNIDKLLDRAVDDILKGIGV